MTEPTRTVAPVNSPSVVPSGTTVSGGVTASGDSRPADPVSPPGYALGEEIGSGGMGVVFRARDAKGRPVALICPDLPEFRGAFLSFCQDEGVEVLYE